MEKGETKLTNDRLEKLAKLYKMNVDLIKLNEQAFIQNITQAKICSSKTETINLNNPPSNEERKLYQSTIARLEKEQPAAWAYREAYGAAVSPFSGSGFLFLLR